MSTTIDSQEQSHTPGWPDDAGPLWWFFRGVRHAVSVPALVLLGSFIGFGGMIHGVGFPILAATVSTIFIWALPAQVILVGGVVAGTPLPAIALAVGLSSVRLLPMAVSMAPYMRGSRRNLWVDLLCSHYVAMTLWVEGLRLLPKVPAEGRIPFTLGLGNTYIVVSLVGMAIGYNLSDQLPPPLAAALLLLTPLSFTVLMIRNASTATDWLALAAGVVLMPLAGVVGSGLDLMVAGVGGGTLAYGIGRWLRRRR